MRAIVVDRLSKEYVLGSGRPDGRGASGGGRFFALKDVSFEVRAGEVLGIVGRNGAGKSTLLKILSRITAPTSGRAEISGRLSSLLEVGTGFHPELTGAENVFLNGSILGMSRAEIRAKFDEIVAFAEVEKFIDTPVKRYSSGMYVRLAFAVAAHLDPEILVIDEVLAVGDLRFQKRCLGKMDEAASRGKTILLVSHNMSTILSLATRCLLLSEGRLVRDGAPADVVGEYREASSDAVLGRTDLSDAERYGNGKARFVSVRMTPLGEAGERIPCPVTGCGLEFEVGVRADADIADATVALIFYDEPGHRLVDVNTLIKGKGLSLKGGEEATVRFRLEDVRLKPDVYTVGLWLGVLNDADIDGVRHGTAFRMEPRREDVLYTAPFPGAYACRFSCDVPGGE